MPHRIGSKKALLGRWRRHLVRYFANNDRPVTHDLLVSVMPAKADSFTVLPAQIVGAGLPVLAIGYGVYWLVKRRRKTD